MASAPHKALREGFTTGSAATGAALAALHLLCSGEAATTVRVPLPPFSSEPTSQAGLAPQPAQAHEHTDALAGRWPRGWRELPVMHCAAGPAAGETLHDLLTVLASTWALPPDKMLSLRMAHASIRKDGGDDPDATSGACITATVIMGPPHLAAFPLATDQILLEGGSGVGRVTLPGLPVPVGDAAINPVPRSQIRFALAHYVASHGGPYPPLAVLISVPEGARIARHTFNPRLGITGGISILGTQGTVRPYSHKAWQATIEQGLHVALATGSDCICLSTGRRSEKLLMAKFPHLPERCFVQAADFAAFSLKAAGALPFKQLVWGCFFGKLLKLAQGHGYTHAKDATLDMRALAVLCREKQAGCAHAVAQCITAAHALELLLDDAAGPSVLAAVRLKAAAVASAFAGRPVDVYLFHTDGRELVAP